MPITIELSPDAEARLSQMAEIRGVDVTTYVKSLVESAIVLPSPQGTQIERQASIEKFLARISQFSNQIPDLPDYAFTRESFYQDDRR